MPDDPDEAALEWLVRLRDDEADGAQTAAFQNWLNADLRHRHAFRRAERAWGALDALPTGRRRARHRRPSSLTRIAAMLALTVSGAIGWQAATWSGAFADHSTWPGQQRQIALTDGSEVFLNTSTSLSTDWGAARRTVTLHRGEAFFAVAPDTERPFVVLAGDLEVKALGTAFSVEIVEDGADVIVTEHSVSVSSEAAGQEIAAAPARVRVSAGRMLASKDVSVETLLAWRRGRIIFNDVPLGEVMAELERYLLGRIVIADPSVAELPVTASFRIDDIDGALDAIEQSLPITLRRVGDLFVLVTAN
ncbi:MAG: FecR family protein [Pseudomonadota bacterium]